MRFSIIGAGPAGLTLALALSGSGKEVVVYERDPKPSKDWRASTFHAATLDLLHDLSPSLVEIMHSEGLVARDYRLHDRETGLIAEFDFSELAAETMHPYRLQLEQYKYSQILLEEIDRAGDIEVLYNHEYMPDNNGWGYVYNHRTNERIELSGFVVGADGASSAFRKSVGSEFDGHTYPQRFLIISVTGEVQSLMPNLGLVNYIWDPVQPAMILRIPDLWRVMFPVGHSNDETKWYDLAKTNLSALAPGQIERLRIHSGQIYSIHQRIADTFIGPNWALIGDAAHINSPIGGLGLNGGIHDALHLSKVLAKADPLVPRVDLERFATMRQRSARDFVRKITSKNTDSMFESSEERRQRNIDEIRELKQDSGKRLEWLRDASMLNARKEYFDQQLTG